MKLAKIIVIAVTSLSLSAIAAAQEDTLGTIKNRGELVCGVSGSLPGFSAPDDTGHMRGFDADFCYALSAAIFGDQSKVRFLGPDRKGTL